jgi:hypothetical protein
MKILELILRLPKVVMDISEICEELKDLRSSISDIKCELSRQGEELDVLYDTYMHNFQRS